MARGGFTKPLSGPDRPTIVRARGRVSAASSFGASRRLFEIHASTDYWPRRAPNRLDKKCQPRCGGAAYVDGNLTLFNRNAFPITDTLLKLIAAAASIGLSSAAVPKNGTSIPAAIGTPSAL